MSSTPSYNARNVLACRAFYAELIVFLQKKIQESGDAGVRSYADIEVEHFWSGHIHISSSRAIVSHHPFLTSACEPTDLLMLDLDPFPRRGILAGFSRVIQNRRLASLGKDGFFAREWSIVEKRIAVQEADLRAQRGLPTPPALAAREELRELSTMIPTPAKAASKRRNAL